MTMMRDTRCPICRREINICEEQKEKMRERYRMDRLEDKMEEDRERDRERDREQEREHMPPLLYEFVKQE
jgi:hypothetical protein